MHPVFAMLFRDCCSTCRCRSCQTIQSYQCIWGTIKNLLVICYPIHLHPAVLLPSLISILPIISHHMQLNPIWYKKYSGDIFLGIANNTSISIVYRLWYLQKIVRGVHYCNPLQCVFIFSNFLIFLSLITCFILSSVDLASYNILSFTSVSSSAEPCYLSAIGLL